MAKIKIQLEYAEAKAELTGILTAGMVGVPVRFAFGHVWNGLVKTAVFQGSGETVVNGITIFVRCCVLAKGRYFVPSPSG